MTCGNAVILRIHLSLFHGKDSGKHCMDLAKGLGTAGSFRGGFRSFNVVVHQWCARRAQNLLKLISEFDHATGASLRVSTLSEPTFQLWNIAVCAGVHYCFPGAFWHHFWHFCWHFLAFCWSASRAARMAACIWEGWARILWLKS